MKNFRIILAAITASGCMALSDAAVPANYYGSCENKAGAELLSALCRIVGPHTAVGYGDLWTVYKTADVYPNGKIWDMYSTKEWTAGTEQCGNYKNVGDCYNREHSMPKSWFADATPMYTDAFHIYPTDGRVNGQRGDFPYGECAKGTTLPANGSVLALGRLGTSTFPGYTGTVFEPDDQYKGDFARSYFYMAASYNDRIAGWNSDMLDGSAYPAFASWAVEMLMKWHRQDPVSDKEIQRNEAVWAIQGNRNPFIDNPDMAEHIWGDKKSEGWIPANPAIIYPANNSTILLPTAGVGIPRQTTIYVTGKAVSGPVSLTVDDPSGVFAVSTTVLQAAAVNSTAGCPVTITVTPREARNYQAALKLKSTTDKIDVTATLSFDAVEGLRLSDATHISDCSFMIHWTYIGDDNNGKYSLSVTDEDGKLLDSYPRDISAADESAVIEGLEPETTYSVFIKGKTLTSNTLRVTTASPIPDIQVLYDGELSLVSEPDMPSNAEELLLDIENIFDPITFTVSSPFQLSSNKSDWSTSLSVDPREDRMYIRIFSSQPGVFSSAIHALTTNFEADVAVVEGSVQSASSFFEDFENNGHATNNYTSTPYVGNAATWQLVNAGVYNADKKEPFSGTHNLRFGKESNSSATMATDKENGMGTVSLWAAGWSAADGASAFTVSYSTDGGTTWQSAGSVSIAAPSSSSIEYKQYFFTVNQTGPVRLRIQQTSGKRMCFDDISATNYYSSTPDNLFGDEKGNGWDAWCDNGLLCVSLSRSAHVAIHGMDGITYVSDNFNEGLNSLSLKPGLYVVVVGKSTRRVLVK